VEPQPAVARPRRIRIDLASRRDVDAIGDVILTSFREFEPLYTPAGYRATTPTPTELAARLAEGPTWIAVVHGTVVGTVSAVGDGDEVYIRSMAVRPEARGSGVATQLLDRVTAFASERGARRLRLKTTPFLADAIRLYERAGFRRTPNACDLHGTPLIEMARDLR
jgi:ribosomal protein S18 acetylase RimI-like enzyme